MVLTKLVLVWITTILMVSANPGSVDVSNKTLTCIPIIPKLSNVSITKLILHHNRIVMNSSNIQALSEYTNLTELDISYNQIEDLPAKAFSSLVNLEVLKLRGNKLQTVTNKTFTGLQKLKKIDLQDNPWNCTCLFVKLIKWMNNSGVQTEGGTCVSPETMAKKNVLDVFGTCSSTSPPVTTSTEITTTTTSVIKPSAPTTTTKTATVTATAPWTSHVGSSILANSRTGKDSLSKTGKSGNQESGAGVNNTWKFLAGVIVIALCTSMFIVCAVKSPSWYKLLFNYRHQRLREEDEPNVFSAGRYSNFSLDTEQTETSAHELDQGPEQQLEDEDGFIEDRYIQPEDYKNQPEDYKEHTDVDEL